MTPAIAALIIGGALLVAGWTGRDLRDVLSLTPSEGTKLIPDSVVNGLPSLSPGPQTGGSGDPLTTVITECNRIAGLRLRYLWGGGHAGYPPDGPFDCSGAVSYVLHAAGLLHGPPVISTLFMTWGKPGPGQRLTVYANPSHVFLVIDGRVWQTSNSNPGGGPGWTAPRSTAGFVARHYPGL